MSDNQTIKTAFFQDSNGVLITGQCWLAKLHRKSSGQLPANSGYESQLNPNEYWFEGKGKLSCFEETKNYDSASLRLTSPMRCRPVPKARRLAMPEFSGEFHELKGMLESGDKDLFNKWQTYFTSLGIYAEEIDGIYSPATRTALSKCGLIEECWRELNTGQ